MKTVWKGGLSFGLVNIPVDLYSATKEHSLGFKLLHDKCHTPISYKRWCTHCKQEVSWQHIVKGLPLENGTYFILTQENLKKLKPEKTDTIDIVEFIDHDVLAPIYLDHHYYIIPHKINEKAFFLFTAALNKLGKIGIGRFVMRDKEYVCAIKPYGPGLLLSTLNYSYEIREFPKVTELKKPKLEPKELQLAEQLINKLYTKKFSIDKFKDTFAERIKAALKLAQKGKKPKTIKPRARKKETGSLMETLQASLGKSRRAPTQPRAYAGSRSHKSHKLSASKR